MATKKNNQAEEKLRYVTFEWNGTEYTMEFNRRTAEFVERELGVNVLDILQSGDVRLTDLPQLFRASLLMHHSKMKAETADAIFECMGDKLSLMTVLIELLSVAVNAIYEEPEEGKAITWTRH